MSILTIAGSDSSGGAGIQGDIKSIHSNGGYALSVVTSVTAQNRQKITKIFDLPIEIIDAQIEAIFADFEVSAVKIGMLSSREIVETVARKLREFKAKNIVVDPVITSTSGSVLLQKSAIETMRLLIFPLATLITPNVDEAEHLSGITIGGIEDAKIASVKISEKSSNFRSAILLKGGHMKDKSATDLLYANGEFTHFDAERIGSIDMHGTGCAYSSAIATHLALGEELKPAIQLAKNYITRLIRNFSEKSKHHP